MFLFKNLLLVLLTVGFFMASNTFAPAALANQKSIGPHVTLKFDEGKYDLTSKAREQLNEVVKKAHETNKEIEKVQIATWSDKPTPKKGEQLSKADRALAEERNKNIKDYLKNNLKIDDTSVFNMAERPNWMARFLESKDAELKAEVNTTDENHSGRREFQVIKENGDVSKSVVLILFKERT